MTDSRDAPMGTMSIDISVIMPVRDESGTIAAALDSVLAQELDRTFEVVIADGQSTDGTREYLDERAASTTGCASCPTRRERRRTG